MATYSHRERTITYHEWTVPAEALGACWSEVSRALNEAIARWELVHKHSKRCGHSVPDDVIRIFPADDKITIRFEVQESQICTKIPF